MKKEQNINGLIFKCEHSKTREYGWEWDSGYGKQVKHVGLICESCGFKSPYADKDFYDPEDFDDE